MVAAHRGKGNRNVGPWGFAHHAVDAHRLDRFRLAVHDAGGRVGLDLARRCGGQIQSLTILTTVLTTVLGWARPLPRRGLCPTAHNAARPRAGRGVHPIRVRWQHAKQDTVSTRSPGFAPRDLETKH
jgi:pimeloyl-ACP methyl ester carboxylesterase